MISTQSLISLEAEMASITIRNLEDGLKTALRVEAANNNRSMEEEARIILRTALSHKKNRGGLGSRIAAMFADESVELELPQRRELPRAGAFDE
jgi:plasmid stability protein